MRDTYVVEDDIVCGNAVGCDEEEGVLVDFEDFADFA